MDCKENIRPHNPKVGSSNLPPATKVTTQTGTRKGPFFIVYHWVGFVSKTAG